MARRKKTTSEEMTNARIGSTMERCREECGYPLKFVADALGYSIQHVSALESGAYTVSATILEKLTHIYQCPISTFLPDTYRTAGVDTEWHAVRTQLSERDRIIIVDFAKMLANWSTTASRKAERQQSSKKVRLVSLEGIDGGHLHTLGTGLVTRSQGKIVYCPHDYDSALWRHMIEHFAKIDKTRADHRALERTLLFACEKLFRHAEQITPALQAGKIVIAPYLSMASSVFQQVEGVGDHRIVDLMEALLPRPDMTMVIRSSARGAARKAVSFAPSAGKFYSPYEGKQFSLAGRIYENAVREFRERGRSVVVFDVVGKSFGATLDAVYRRLVGKTRS